jgi:hypothetical protein
MITITVLICASLAATVQCTEADATATLKETVRAAYTPHACMASGMAVFKKYQAMHADEGGTFSITCEPGEET